MSSITWQLTAKPLCPGSEQWRSQKCELTGGSSPLFSLLSPSLSFPFPFTLLFLPSLPLSSRLFPYLFVFSPSFFISFLSFSLEVHVTPLNSSEGAWTPLSTPLVASISSRGQLCNTSLCFVRSYTCPHVTVIWSVPVCSPDVSVFFLTPAPRLLFFFPAPLHLLKTTFVACIKQYYNWTARHWHCFTGSAQ